MFYFSENIGRRVVGILAAIFAFKARLASSAVRPARAKNLIWQIIF
jgi:hypothetical protein